MTNGDWTLDHDDSALVALNLAAVEAAVASPAAAGSALGPSAPCRQLAARSVQCDADLFIDAGLGLRLPRGAGNVVVDRIDVERGSARAYLPTRIDPALVWVDVFESEGGELSLDCGRDIDATCDANHVVGGVGPQPALLSLGLIGGFAYLPQLVQRDGDECEQADDSRCSGLTLLDVKAASGPRVIDFLFDFFRQDPRQEDGLAGGFAAAERPCNPDDPPSQSRDCTRPLVYASQRYWNGLRQFTVAPATGLAFSSSSVMLTPNNIDGAPDRPLNGEIAFANPDELYMVSTTPPALSRIDTSLDAAADPRNIITQTVSLCSNPNHLALWQPSNGERLAFVSCYSDGRVSAVELDTMRVVRTIHLGPGSNELLVDAERQWLFAANVIEGSISIIELDQTHPAYLEEIITLGPRDEREP